MGKINGESDRGFYIGQKIRILDGSWIEFTAVITGIDFEKKKVVVLINFWGKDTPIELNFVQIEPLTSAGE